MRVLMAHIDSLQIKCPHAWKSYKYYEARHNLLSRAISSQHGGKMCSICMPMTAFIIADGGTIREVEQNMEFLRQFYAHNSHIYILCTYPQRIDLWEYSAGRIADRFQPLGLVDVICRHKHKRKVFS